MDTKLPQNEIKSYKKEKKTNENKNIKETNKTDNKVSKSNHKKEDKPEDGSDHTDEIIKDDHDGNLETDALYNNRDVDGNEETDYLIENNDPPTEVLTETGNDYTDNLTEEDKDQMLKDNVNREEDDKIWGRPEDDFRSDHETEVIETHGKKEI